MRILMMTAAIVALTACGGGRVSGEIGQACMDADRSAANRQLCSCIQRAANGALNAADQRRAATFFEEPQLAQDTRQSDNSRLEEFWRRYRAFSRTAEASCR